MCLYFPIHAPGCQDPRDILEIWAPSMPLLAEAAQHDARLLRMAAALATNANVGRPFAQALLAFLVDKRLLTLQQPSSPARPSLRAPVSRF